MRQKGFSAWGIQTGPFAALRHRGLSSEAVWKYTDTRWHQPTASAHADQTPEGISALKVERGYEPDNIAMQARTAAFNGRPGQKSPNLQSGMESLLPYNGNGRELERQRNLDIQGDFPCCLNHASYKVVGSCSW